MANPKKREQEQAYLIFHEDLAAVATDFLEREELGGFTLNEPVLHEIKDVYYDTPDNDLRMSTVTLRTRLIDGELLITFKGKEKVDQDYTQDHSEWEFPWPVGTGLAPETIAELAGFAPVQERTTHRATRNLFAGEELVGEVNFDKSLYDVSTGQARIFEFEVERQGKVKLKNMLPSIEADLPFLARWNHGKFVTGKAIEFAFGVKTDDKLNLDLDSFNYIEQMFKQLKVK